MWHKRIYLQNSNRLTDTEDRLVDAEGAAGGRGGLGVWGERV